MISFKSLTAHQIGQASKMIGVGVIALLAVASCASQEGTASGNVNISIVAASSAETDMVSHENLVCDENSQASGSYAKKYEGAADDVCEMLKNVDMTIFSPDKSEICTEQYGGPEIAEISGIINEREVQANFERNNGCAIGRWNRISTMVEPMIVMEPEPGFVEGSLKTTTSK